MENKTILHLQAQLNQRHPVNLVIRTSSNESCQNLVLKVRHVLSYTGVKGEHQFFIKIRYIPSIIHGHEN